VPVEIQLGIAEVEVGEELVFLKQIVGHDRRAEVGQLAHLRVTLFEKPHLRGKGHAGLRLIEAVKKGIVLRLGDAARLHLLRKNGGEA